MTRSLLVRWKSKCSIFIMVIMLLCCFNYPLSRGNHLLNGVDTQLLKALRDSFIDRRDAISIWFNSDTTSPCNWTGIKCEGLNLTTVTQIDMSFSLSPLNLPFPNTLIIEFKSLKNLNLSNCAFTGDIFPQFWEFMENLEVLDLSGNRLSGTLPPIIGKLKHLKQLILDHNNFSGTLPCTISQLIDLKELSLRSNSFSGNLPDEIGNLHMMESFDISSNFFTGNFPSSLFNLTRLLFFDAHQNRFTGQLSPEIGNITKLQILNLGWNSFSGAIPSAIGDMKDLTVLNIQGCQFTGSVPEQVSMLSNLSYLNLAQNDFDGELLPSGIGNLVNLVYLIAPYSGLVGKIPSQLGNCKKLKILDLSFNSFNGPLHDNLAGLDSINSVILASNRLSGPLPIWISNWKQIQFISISDNKFSGPLPPLEMPLLSVLDAHSNVLSGELSAANICETAPSLTTLILSRNNFSGTIDKNNTFNNCLNLTYLVLSENNISGELPGYIGKMKQLLNFEISMNKLSGKIPDQLWESKTLMGIVLSGNSLQGPLSARVGNISTLVRLQIDDNLLHGSIPASIGNLKNLTNLSLHGNKLTGDIPSELFDCTMLVSLDLGGNRLTGEIPKSISKLRLLDNLVLSNNLISGQIPEEICSGFKEIPLPDSEYVQHYGMLDLSHNELKGPIPDTIKNCIVVKEILFNRNKLNGSIPLEISSLANLTLLDISYNSFSGLVDPQLFTMMMSVQGLILSHNRLQGFAPHNNWSPLQSLAKLDLSNNWISGQLPPSLFSLERLTYLDGSMNNISGSLTIHDINGRSALLVLNISNNKFDGTLDDNSISKLLSLLVLDLHHNTFTGSLPSSLPNLVALTYLDLSENNFQNSFPCNICTIQGLLFTNFSDNSFSDHSPQSCIDEKSPCINLGLQHHSLRSTTMFSRTSAIGIAIGCVFVFLIITLFFCLIKKLKSKGHNDSSKQLGMRQEKTSSGEGLLLGKKKKTKEPLSINIATFEHSLLRIKAADISSATENFSKSYIIGDGGFGTVYKASLIPHGPTIAVKRLNGCHSHGEREFMAEMETIGKVKHDNLVPLLGYCVFADERILIYEYMENGSLDFWLRNNCQVSALDWPTRLKICLGSARGLAFLHHGFVPHIIHRDVKSSNILLDGEFEARVSDFGLARIISACESHVSTVLAGTFGYIPPEYGQAMVATTKGDVYSFGVVMLEIMTGRAPIGQADVEGGNLVGWVRWMVDVNGTDPVQIFDPFLSGSGCFSLWKDQMLSVLSVARSCTSDEPWMRPTMFEVVKMLKRI